MNYAAAPCRTDHPRYGPALEIVDRPSTNLARLRGTKTVPQAWTLQTLNESTQASRAYRGAPSVVDLRPELHSVNRFESFKLPQADLAIHAVRIAHGPKSTRTLFAGSRTLKLIVERDQPADQLRDKRLGFEAQPCLQPPPCRTLVNLLPSPERVKDGTPGHQRDFALPQPLDKRLHISPTLM
jgi:hypothetical protein